MIKRTILLAFSLLLLVQISIAQKQKTVAAFDATKRPKQLSDSALLDLVQQQTFRYFWDFAHPVSGLSRERSNVAYEYGAEVVTTGGTGVQTSVFAAKAWRCASVSLLISVSAIAAVVKDNAAPISK